MRKICPPIIVAALLSVALIPVGCQKPHPAPTSAPAGTDAMTSVNTLFPAPDDYAKTRIGSAAYPIPPWAKFLKDVKIVLDPGHGGDSHKSGFKRGPTGVREAEMNLRVAQYLRDFLVASGAQVKLTRESDVDLSLPERAAVANDWGADLFVSCHHNAVDKPEVNYTTVWYHADVDFRPSSLDLARYLSEGLHDQFPQPKLMDVPLKSDQLMYPNGFGVLAASRVTCALCESSFYTNPAEEQRLRDPEHNLREAYGIFLGFARYAQAGVPRATLVEPTDTTITADASTKFTFRLDDGLRGRKSWGSERQMILSDSIAVKLDGRRLPFSFLNAGYILTTDLPPGLAPGKHTLSVQFENKNKNSVLNPEFVITVRPPTTMAPTVTFTQE